jgi:type IV pilus assembly protein PilA
MSNSLRPRAADERGFTLIELLIVMLIIGILAAIAIPSFLNQKRKGDDAAAKTQARTAETAAETYSVDHNGDYTGLTVGELQRIEPTLNETSAATLTVVGTPTAVEYTVRSSSSATGDTFSITREGNGLMVRTCTGTKGGCPATLSW